MKYYKILGDYILRNPFCLRGIWYGRVRHRVSGKEFRFTTRERNRRKSDQFVLEWVQRRIAHEEGMELNNEPLMRFDRAFEEWVSLKTIRATTQREYSSCYVVIRPEFGNFLVSDVRMENIEKFIKKLEVDRKQAPSTRGKYLFILRSFFQWAKRRKYCRENPTEGLKIRGSGKRVGIALSQEDAKRLLKASQTPLIHRIKRCDGSYMNCKYPLPEHIFLSILIALHTGLRKSNITGMRWRHIDFEKRRISFKKEEMKSNVEHEVPIHPELAEILEKKLRELGNVDSEGFVLGKEVNEFRCGFRGALKRAELPHMRFHDLRHTLSTWLAVRFPQAIKDAILGHRPSSVSAIYTHVQFDDMKKAIDAMPRLLSNNDNEGMGELQQIL